MERTIRDFLSELDPEILCADGYDEAIIGYSHVSGSFRAVYDMEKMVCVFMRTNDTTREEAVSYLQYNCWDSVAGERNPIYIDLITNEDIGEWLEDE